MRATCERHDTDPAPETGIACLACIRARRRAARAEAVSTHRASILRQCGVPRRLAEMKFENPEPWPRPTNAESSANVAQWSGCPWAVTFIGDYGVGKSALACELLARTLMRGLPAMWMPAGRVPAIRFGEDENIEFHALENAGMIVIDELGRGHMGKAWQAIGELIAARHAALRPTVLTTNLPLARLMLEDGHAADRLRDGWIVTMEGRSRRGTGQ
jgi:DNA replication protein DnaC